MPDFFEKFGPLYEWTDYPISSSMRYLTPPPVPQPLASLQHQSSITYRAALGSLPFVFGVRISFRLWPVSRPAPRPPRDTRASGRGAWRSLPLALAVPAAAASCALHHGGPARHAPCLRWGRRGPAGRGRLYRSPIRWGLGGRATCASRFCSVGVAARGRAARGRRRPSPKGPASLPCCA